MQRLVAATLAVVLSVTSATAQSKHHRWLKLALADFTPVTTAAVPLPVAAPALPSATKLTQSAVRASPLVLLQRFDVGDIQAALADAEQQNPPDNIAATCYRALIGIVQANVPASIVPPGSGTFQTTQKSRHNKNLNAALQSPAGALSGFGIACAPLMLDDQSTLVAVGIYSGLVAP